ncbi:sporadic carbohydrate cluster 2OG-Fe(II) oxygenase [Azospirillum sp. B4]|uniref:sporadic carbohydrate cluster 2OG-Fe(II) oxygenase n=1 Tax=Azospirillum sp. B4 TaxID=95605 RepID=UPI000349F2C3|nr:sporadic carbohydrate cluster 2OG-Fe(II) oxygenase [Azospirillum sp. B4]
MTNFLSADEQALTRRFMETGHIIAPAEDRAALDRIRDLLVRSACEWLDCPPPADPDTFLNGIGERVPVDRLNDFRLHQIGRLNAEPWARAAYFAAARRTLETLVGNELAMQRRLNLSIQLSGDDSSLLPVHADVWSGDSPFELVLWIPLVDCYRTKSMYLLPPGPSRALQERMAGYTGRNTDDIYQDIEPDLLWLDIPYGHFLLFNQNLPHGNRVNQEPEARWSMNCRFKGVFTPYADKRLGEFFEPVTLRAASRLGMAYDYPTGFKE